MGTNEGPKPQSWKWLNFYVAGHFFDGAAAQAKEEGLPGPNFWLSQYVTHILDDYMDRPASEPPAIACKLDSPDRRQAEYVINGWWIAYPVTVPVRMDQYLWLRQNENLDVRDVYRGLLGITSPPGQDGIIVRNVKRIEATF